MDNLNEKLASSLLAAMRGVGADEVFPEAEVAKNRIENLKKFEELELQERSNRTRAFEAASRTYLTF